MNHDTQYSTPSFSGARPRVRRLISLCRRSSGQFVSRTAEGTELTQSSMTIVRSIVNWADDHLRHERWPPHAPQSLCYPLVEKGRLPLGQRHRI